MKTSVVIAAYFTDNRFGVPNLYFQDCLFFIKKHIEILNEFKNQLEDIYFVCTFDEPFSKKEYVNSYFEDVLKNNSKISIFERENLGGSYASWHSVLNYDNGKSDYIIFVEDDYGLLSGAIDKMHKYYKETPEMIYLCQLWNTNRYTHDGMDIAAHAQISNGMINAKLYKELKEKVGLDFTLYYTPGKTTIYNNQVSFLEQYRSNGILIRDMKDKYGCVFNNDSNSSINFCNQNGEHIFMPITEYYPNHHPNLRYNW